MMRLPSSKLRALMALSAEEAKVLNISRIASRAPLSLGCFSRILM